MDWVKEKMHQARLQRNRLQGHGQIPLLIIVWRVTKRCPAYDAQGFSP